MVSIFLTTYYTKKKKAEKCFHSNLRDNDSHMIYETKLLCTMKEDVA